jgi:uncharacterized protein YkwD
MALRRKLVDRIGVRISPRMLAALSALAAVAVSAALAVAASGATRSERSLGSLNHQVLAAINAYRAQHGLHALTLATGLDRSASEHSFEMGADGYFAHNSADGEAFWKRIQRYYSGSHSSYWSVGENLLWAAPGVSAQRAMQLWIASPEHKANLLAPRWRQIGISAVHVLAAPGTYHGLTVTIITTDFGVRR